MSRRDRATLALGILVALGLVAYPLAYRLIKEGSVAPTGPSSVAAEPTAPPSSNAPAPPTTAPSPPPTPESAAIDTSWLQTALEHRDAPGGSFAYTCTPNGIAGQIWGTDVYTDDSSVCTAGVHKGVITLEAGGTVTILIRPGLDIYISSTRNGIRSDAWDHWDGSYEVVEP